ncbi:MAG: hypothetical protein M3Q07_14740 [Pseudobdellovibrionaceae bacterium]|nr:hypothetical protein [Pseudobdellovibrionaceae bacterium]
MQRANELQPTNRKNLGFKVDEDCWTIIKIDNRSAQVERAFLEHGLSLTSRLDIFHETKGSLRQEKTLGLHVPFVEWSVDYRLPIFDLQLEPGLNTIVVRQKSRDVMVLDWRLYSPENFYSRIVTELLLFGGFFSICVALAFYNIVIYFVNREISHVFYFCYLNLYALAQLYLVGLLKQLALPHAGAGVHQLGLITIAAALAMTSYFVYYFLDFPAYKPWFRRMIHTFAWMQWIVVVLSLADQILWAAIFCQMFSLLGSVMAVLSAAIAVKRRHPLANYFIIAWTMLIVGNVIQVMHLQGLVPDVPWVVSMNFVGASFEAIIISYALAHKMRLGRLQEAQKRRHAFSQLEKMVHPHQIEQMKRGDILETTMPHASGDAVVLCLDIIASTSSQIENLSNFLRRFFDRCEILMSRDYKGEELSASGYRIKEMGDGFLCAVGFPFMTPPGRSPHEVAIELAFGFLEAFDQEFSQTVSAERTFCSLGLAHGSIQGFFTVSGIRSYELFGDSIVLATRYESLRKQWPPERPGHVMTLQHRLYECLPPHYQSLFQCHKLKPGAGAIRNDADAEAFYRGIFPSGAAARILANADPTRREDLAS